MLFASQIYFNMNPPTSILLRISILSTIMIVSSKIWVRTEQKGTLHDWLGLDARRITLLTYTALAAVLVFFTHSSFKEATILAGGSLILPVVEELYFRCYLLGSAVRGWPDFYSLDRGERGKFVRKATKPLILSSIAFALVHDDVISLIIKGTAAGYMLPVLILLRATFGLAVGGMYILQRNLAVPAAFHVAFNLSFYILNK
jgi:membrane protease YdiL (CAAX protease family)